MRVSILWVFSLPILVLAGTQAHADFQSPTGNVVCSTSAENNPSGGVTCDINEKYNSQPAKPRPIDCNLEWGGRFSVERTGRASLNCYGDYLYDSHPTILNYGQTLKGKTYECTSQTTGMTCKNTSGHGFTLSKSSQRLF